MKQIKDILQQEQSQYNAYENNTQRFEALMQRVDKAEAAEKSQDTATNGLSDWFGNISRWLLGESQPRLRFAALAMTAVIVGQAAYIATQSNTSTTAPVYQAASGEADKAATEGQYLVIFNASADINAVNRFLSENNGQIVKGPESGAIYTVYFAGELSEARLDALQNNTLVEFFDKSE